MTSTESIGIANLQKQEEKKNIIQLASIAILISLIISFLFFQIGANYLAIDVSLYGITMVINVLLYKKSNREDPGLATVIISNVFIAGGIILSGLNSGLYLFFLSLFVAFPFLVNTSRPYRKKLIFYYVLTSLTFIGCILLVPEVSNLESISATQYRLLFLVNSGGALFVALAFSYKGILFTRSHVVALLEQKTIAEQLNSELVISSAKTLEQSNALQQLNKRLQLQSKELQEQSKELQVQSDNLVKANEKLKVERERADEANKTKGVFLATMSHEIRTPMNGIIGMNNLLADTPLTAEQLEYVQIINTSGDALLSIINDILDFSKIESGSVELEFYDFDLRKGIEDVFDLFATKAYEQNIELFYDIDASIEKTIKTDGLRLRQILVNLVGNAVKFTQHGQIYVSVIPKENISGKQVLLFKVADSGIGIAPDKIERLFKAFNQVDSSTTRKYGGTGLGLAISKSLVKLFGGDINVVSEPNVGSTFSFTINAEYVINLEPILENSLLPKTVLLFDNNIVGLNTLETWLSRLKIKTILAHSAESLMTVINDDNTIDLVIVNLETNSANDTNFLNMLRDVNSKVPVAVLAYPQIKLSHEVTSEFSSILTKPIKQERFYKLLSSFTTKEIQPLTEFKPTYSEEFSKKFPLKILIAEDNIINQKLISKILNKFGYDPEIASDGNVVISMCKTTDFDLILMDVLMPKMDGLETTRYIRKNLNHQPKVIAMTANAMPKDREDCMSAGMDDYLSKPFKLNDLIQVLEQVAIDKGLL
ncbi:response regulator [Pedobacter arcticus]|uniref:response regulator n=1 Tax=Pedobacter arcticus TaxID=752140 RepID=UPI0003617445|nr:response regulator [Pedobacter arcticus]